MQANEALKKMRESMMLQRKSRKTIKVYLAWVSKYVAFQCDKCLHGMNDSLI